MEDLKVAENITHFGSWLVHHQEWLLNYMVNLAAAIAIVIVGIIIARVVSHMINRLMLTREIDETIADFISALVRYAVIAFAVIAALSCIGVQTASVIAVLGAAGLAVGLALQGSLSNLAAGVLLVMFRPLRSGEYVDLGGVSGMVLSVQIFSTTLYTEDGKIAVVPNGKIIAGNIINHSREPIRRNQFIIAVSYDADIDKVKKLLTNIIDSDNRILKDRERIVRLNELAPSSVNYIIQVWSLHRDLQDVYWDVLERIKRDFDANGISFPYPQLDVHVTRPSNDTQ